VRPDPAPIDPSRVAAVVPAFNEAGKIGDVVRKVPRAFASCVIVVDDCSTDGTADEARDAGAERVLCHPTNRGVGAGIRTGLLAAKAAGFEFAAILSGDDQHEPDELPRVLQPLFAGEADLVQGSRWLPGGATPGIPPDRRWLTRLYPLLFRLASGWPSTDATNGFRAFRLALLDDPRIRLDQPWLDR
jgi:glycosyltransferase involved in cell wall biosynthesis